MYPPTLYGESATLTPDKFHPQGLKNGVFAWNMLKMDQIWIETDQKRAQMDQNLLKKKVFLADLAGTPLKKKSVK